MKAWFFIVNCLLLGQGQSDCRQRIAEVLHNLGHELICCDHIDDAKSLLLQKQPGLVIITYIDKDIVRYIDWGINNKTHPAVWAAVLDHEPDVSLKQLIASGFDDLITPPLTDFRLASRLHFIIRHAKLRLEHTYIEKALAESNARISAVMETTVDGIITINDRGIIQSFNQAAEHIFGYSRHEAIGQNVSILMPSPHKEEHDGFIRSYHETGHRKIIGIGREVKGQRKNGDIFPLELAVSEIHPNGERTYTGVIRDISSRRHLEKQILATSEQERRRIGQDLHDGLGQMLTGIGLITQNLSRQLESKGLKEAQEVTEIMGLIKEADQQARTLARTLIPFELDNGGLKTALNRLGDNINLLFGLQCTVEEVGEVPVVEEHVTGHFYRIIQEAMNNAARHSKATQIKVSIAGNAQQIRVRIQDNGVGINEHSNNGSGMGLRIMKYRAEVIGASLEVRRGTENGTVVTCTVPLDTHEQASPQLKAS